MNIKKLVKFEKRIDYFLFFIIVFKLIFIFSSLGHVVASRSNTQNAQNIDKKMVYWKKHTEFIFILSMAILLILIFNPYRSIIVDENSSDLLFLFGIILVLTSVWNVSIKESPLFKNFISIFK
jgi:hypothetical protein